MVRIDTALCTGCASCVKDCFHRNIEIRDKKAHICSSDCFHCGHCVAVCPVNAVSLDDYDMADVTEMAPINFTAESILSFIKLRRSIRQFKDRTVEQKLIRQIIEAGRYTATASNRQELTFIVVEKEMAVFREQVITRLAEKGREILASDSAISTSRNYAKRWIAAEESYRENPDEKDILFFNAPVVILIAGDHQIDAGLAASNMELVACASGLGVLYSGFITRGTDNEETRKTLKIPEGKDILIALVIGYPDVQYRRSAPRKKADVVWC